MLLLLLLTCEKAVGNNSVGRHRVSKRQPSLINYNSPDFYHSKSKTKENILLILEGKYQKYHFCIMISVKLITKRNKNLILNAVNVQYEYAEDGRFFYKRMPGKEVHYLFESHTIS